MARLPLRPRRTAVLAALGLAAAVVLPVLADTPAASAKPRDERVCTTRPNKAEATCFALRRTDVTAQPAAVTPNATPAGFGPADLQSAYALPSGAAGSGRVVAIVDAYDDPNAESDLAAYRSNYGLPACTTANGCFRKVNQTGGTSYPSADTGWAGEISLDLDMVSAACPLCRILLVEATTPSLANLGTAVNRAAALGAVAISNSYGGAESSSAATYDASYYRHPGVAVTASSGDSGYGASYPATSPYVTAVGGTSLARSSTSRGWSETAWSSAGSGCSAYEARPTWQVSACSKRAEADVAAVADPSTGVAVYQTYGGSGWQVYGGTSAASPLVASVYAMAAAPASSAYPVTYPYANPGALYDVTTGSNGTCSAVPANTCTAGVGWDGPTGLGTPHGTAAFGPTSTPASDFAVTVSPGSGAAKQGGSTAATVSTTTTAGSAQTVSLSASGLPAGVTASFSPASVTSGATSTLTLSPGAGAAPGTYAVTVTGSAPSGSHSATYSLTVTSAASSCAGGQVLANPGFESGAAGWTATSGVITTSSTGEPAHSGSYLAWLDGYGSTHTDTLTQSVAVPAGCTSYVLSYWLHIDTAESGPTAYDTLTVKVGQTVVATYSNVNAAAGYVQHSVALSGVGGTTQTVSFSATEDSSLQTSFVLDDTALTAS